MPTLPYLNYEINNETTMSCVAIKILALPLQYIFGVGAIRYLLKFSPFLNYQ